MQKHITPSSGFTLVELAITITIIAILIGGVLKGQEMIDNARVTSTVAQVNSYSAAVSTFKKIYGELPGDLPDAANRLKDCGACDPDDAKAGDGWVGNQAINLTGSDRSLASAWQQQTAGGGVQDETLLFWIHLTKAGLIDGISATATDTTPAWGITHPAAKMGGGFLAGSLDNDKARMTGLMLALAPTPQKNTDNEYLMTPIKAGMVDRKMDDGYPLSGIVQDAVGFFAPSSGGGFGGGLGPMIELNRAAAGSTSGCRMSNSAVLASGASAPGYQEDSEQTVCNLAIKLKI